MLQRRIDEALDTCKSYNGFKFPTHLSLAHPKNGSAQVDIFSSSELGMKASADFEQATDTSADFGESCSRTCDARKKLQECCFTRSISTDQTYDLALLDIETDISQSPKKVRRLARAALKRCLESARQHVAQGKVALPLAHAIAFSEILYMNDRFVHSSTALASDHICHRSLHFLKICDSA